MSILAESKEDKQKILKIQFVRIHQKLMLEKSRICRIAKKAIMVLGLTGTGKTTLINYLNDVPLVGMKKDSSWRVTLKNESHRLPCRDRP